LNNRGVGVLNGQSKSTEELTLQETQDYVVITLKETQYQLERLDQYHLFLEKQKNFMVGEILSSTEEKLVIRYHKEKGMQSLAQIGKKIDPYQRLVIAQKMGDLVDFLGSPVQPYLHPDNLFIFGEELRIAHRGFIQAVVPYVAEQSLFIKQYRALLLAILHPETDYRGLMEGISVFRDVFSKKIQEAGTINELHQLIGTRIVQQKNKRQTENFFVKKRKYRLYKWGMVIFIFLTSCFMGIVGDYQLKRIPTLERFSQAKALFIDEDYPGVLMMLREDKIADLSESTRYVLAVSSVHVTTLADKQKRGILELLSKKASDDLLLYWVYIGKGALEKALEIAKKSEDKPAILYVYTKLYDESQTKQQMESKKKQELRTEYKEAIEYYSDLVEGKFITD